MDMINKIPRWNPRHHNNDNLDLKAKLVKQATKVITHETGVKVIA
jgi:hypothetical protein